MKDTSIAHRFFSVRASALDDNRQKVSGTGHVCLVAKASPKNPTNFKVAVSFKSPVDKLNKELGLKIAEGRLVSSRPGRNFKIRANSVDEAFKVAIEAIFTKQRKVVRKGETVVRPFVPDWLHQAVIEQKRKVVSLKY
jgi:hypothetical protein